MYLNVYKQWKCYCGRFESRTELRSLTTTQLQLPISYSFEGTAKFTFHWKIL